MKTKTSFFRLVSSLALCTVLFAACDKEKTPTPDPDPTPVEVDIYMAGYTSNGNPNYACLWKNGERQTLAGQTESSEACDVLVDGTDVFVCGRSKIDGTSSLCLWKNGTAKALVRTVNTGDAAYKMCLSGSDIYVLGQSWGHGYVWKIDKATLTFSDPHDLGYGNYPNTMCLSGSDIYVGGRTASPGKPTVWKISGENVTPATLSDDSGSVYAMEASGPDIFVAGYEYVTSPSWSNTARVWKIGSDLTVKSNKAVATDPNSCYAFALALSGSSVYVAGSIGSFSTGTGQVWKLNASDLSVTATTPQAGNGGDCRAIFIFGQDVYTAGYSTAEENWPAVVWKNGERISELTGDHSTYGSGIYVTQKP